MVGTLNHSNKLHVEHKGQQFLRNEKDFLASALTT